MNAPPLLMRILRALLALLALFLFARYVWPTRYKYDHVVTDGDTYPVRIDRFSGDADMLTPDDGWYPMGDSDSTGGSPDGRTSSSGRAPRRATS